MIKKVVISAAGRGIRMMELTKDKPKHLIIVEQRPFLAYLLDNVLRAGYREIILVAGFRADLIKDFIKTYSFNDIDYKIEIINQYDILGPIEKEYGTACPLKCVKDFIKNENFISLAGDNFYEVDDLALMNIDDDYNYVAGVESNTPERFGVLIEENGFLKKIIEKPTEFVGNFINVSLYKFTPAIFEKVFQIEKSPRGEYEITDAISLLTKENRVKVKKINNFWMDFGRPEDVEKFSSFLRNKNAEPKR